MSGKIKIYSCIFFRKNLIVSFSLAVFFLSGCRGEVYRGEVSRTFLLMGTFVEVKAMSTDRDEIYVKSAVDGAFSLAKELEDKLSIFNAESEINILNVKKSLKASPDLLAVLMAAERVNRMTSGAFDPTISPILKRNGFYKDMPADILKAIPEDDGGVGFNNVRVDELSGMVSLEGGAWLDLSGIAKGYIVDRMAFFLREKGITIFLINAGGDIYCGAGPSGKKWRIGIKEPGKEGIKAVLEMEKLAVATSGDYENVVVDDETHRVISHIADPGRFTMAEMVPLGFTVIATECVTADGLATGTIVLGPEKAIEAVNNIDGVEIIAFLSPAGEDSVFMSAGAEKYISRR